jgi:Protein of unknown function (DUF2892)
MKSNIGLTDKMLRIILALLIAGLGFYFKSWWGLLAIAPLLTGLASFCPIYKIFGLNTCEAKSVQ